MIHKYAAPHLTADKRKIKDFPKFAFRRTSFMLEPLYAIESLKKVLLYSSTMWGSDLSDSSELFQTERR